MSTGAPRVVAFRAASATAPAWADGVGARDLPVETGDPGRSIEPGLAELLREVDCALVDGGSVDPLPLARAAHRADPDVQVVAVMPTEERRRALTRAMLFTPGLGELWLASPNEVQGALAERAAGVTRQRRLYRRTRERLEIERLTASPQRTERALISDAYLADLLQVTPDAVFSVDELGRVLSANPAAERLLERPGGLTGARLSELLPSVSSRALTELLRRAHAGSARQDVEFPRRGGQPGHGELLVTRVTGSEPPLFAVVLHDETERLHSQRQLEEQAAELEQQSTMLQEQAAELEQVNDELLEQRAVLESALESRSRFYASMSHELRTPINAVIGYNALILDGIYGPLTEPQREAVTRSNRAAGHLLELVNDVLDLAKIEAGRMDVRFERVHPAELAEDLLLSVRPAAEARGTEVRLVCDAPGVRELTTDPRRVRQVLLNLLSNAIKFGAGKPVELRCEPTPSGGVAFHVVDQGVGISPADQERIFEEFVQLGGSGQPGTGLGLAISRRLAELLYGTLSLRSTVGGGSTFTLELPAAPREGATAPRPGGSPPPRPAGAP